MAGCGSFIRLQHTHTRLGVDKIKEYMKGWIRHINFETVIKKVVYE